MGVTVKFCARTAICLLVLIPLVHEHDPFGINTVSPSDAEFMALFTASLEQLPAVMVAASECAALHTTVTRAAATSVIGWVRNPNFIRFS
jgi:hypothetical protein